MRPWLKYIELEQEDILGCKEGPGVESMVMACVSYAIAFLNAS